MTQRSPWTRTDVVGLGVLLAGALGAWQASRVADALGFGPGAPAVESAAAAGGERPRGPSRPERAPVQGRRAGAPLGGFPSGQVARPAPPDARPWPDEPPVDRSRAIATGLAPRETEAEASARLTEEFRRLTRDLEYSPGLPEPRQQRMAPQPEPWRPDPEAAGSPAPVIEGVSPASAPAGGSAEVVIRGQHLRAAQVMFGATAARIIGARPDQVTVVVPPSAAGEVRIALTNEDGQFALSPASFTLRR